LTDVEDVLVTSSLLKMFFRELPERILDDIPEERIVSFNPLRQVEFEPLLKELVDTKRDLFLWFLDLILDALKYQRYNQMKEYDLAKIGAQLLFSEKPDSILTLQRKVAFIERIVVRMNLYIKQVPLQEESLFNDYKTTLSKPITINIQNEPSFLQQAKKEPDELRKNKFEEYVKVTIPEKNVTKTVKYDPNFTKVSDVVKMLAKRHGIDNIEDFGFFIPKLKGDPGEELMVTSRTLFSYTGYDKNKSTKNLKEDNSKIILILKRKDGRIIPQAPPKPKVERIDTPQKSS